MFNVKDRALRGRAQLGLPTKKGPGGKTLYPFPERTMGNVLQGYGYRRSVPQGPAWLSIEEANAWHLASQMEDDPSEFVIVPLQWDHPMRESQLPRSGRTRPARDEW
jgi:hypothetical protein